MDFIPVYLKDTINLMKKDIFINKEYVKEFTNDIKTKDGKILTIK
jgi:hypothetical protein